MRHLDVYDIENSILKITRAIEKKGFGVAENHDLEWWVLAIGEAFDGADFESRELARERLKQQVESAGISLKDYVWVWDEIGCAQLVLATFKSRKMARKMAERMVAKGLYARIKKSMP